MKDMKVFNSTEQNTKIPNFATILYALAATHFQLFMDVQKFSSLFFVTANKLN